MNVLANAFSLQMLNLDREGMLKFTPVNKEDVVFEVSAVGHQDTANVLSSILNVEVPMNRINVKLTENDVLYVAQVVGGRLPEGATTLPDGMSLTFVKVCVQ